MEYSLANLPLNDDVLKNATFVHVPSREGASFAQVEYFVLRLVSKLQRVAMPVIYIYRYNHLLPYQSPHELEQLSEEFSMYQLMEDNKIPQNIWDTATVKEDDDKCYYR